MSGIEADDILIPMTYGMEVKCIAESRLLRFVVAMLQQEVVEANSCLNTKRY